MPKTTFLNAKPLLHEVLTSGAWADVHVVRSAFDGHSARPGEAVVVAIRNIRGLLRTIDFTLGRFDLASEFLRPVHGKGAEFVARYAEVLRAGGDMPPDVREMAEISWELLEMKLSEIRHFLEALWQEMVDQENFELSRHDGAATGAA